MIKFIHDVRQQKKQKRVLNYKDYIADSILNFSCKGQVNKFK